jgi:hypothetical protein
MNLQKLITLLNKQESNLKSFLTIVENKKDALVSNDYELLNKVVANEEERLLSIQLAEEERLIIMQNLFREYGIEKKRYKLEFLLEALEGKINSKIVENIRYKEKQMKDTINEITRVNHLNMMLIQQSRSLINQTIQAIVNSGTKSILDRKG